MVLTAVTVQLGTGPFLDGLRLTSAGPLLLALGVTALTTLCCAWRWRLVAAGLGVPLAPRATVAAVYRAQFLNATLPGGILGDVDRAVGHGRGPDRTLRLVGPGVRAVVWERTLGQAVQIVLTVSLLVALPTALRPLGTAAAAGSVVAAVVLLAAARFTRRTRLQRVLRTDLRCILRTRSARVGIAVLSGAAVAGHLALFLVAAHVAGISASPVELLPLASVVLLASAVPTNVAGWGPREGVAAWVFAAAGLGATAGLTVSVVYGVMALAATLPGAVVLLAGRQTWSGVVIHPSAPVLEEAARG